MVDFPRRMRPIKNAGDFVKVRGMRRSVKKQGVKDDDLDVGFQFLRSF